MSNLYRSASAATIHHNRVGAIMLHLPRYGCFPTARLAQDAGVSKSTVSHLIHGRTNPLYSTAARVVKCLERELGRSLDIHEVFSEDGTYPTPFVCNLVGCPRCLPGTVFDRDNNEQDEYRTVRAGEWTGDTLEFDQTSKQERST